MTTDQPDPTAQPAGQPADKSAAPGDLTARARIREAAISHFADDGYERTTIRAIASTAGVSPGLLRHHFGSKEELRRACDEHIAETLRRINAQYLDDMGGAAGHGDLRRDGDHDRAVAQAGRRGPPRPAGCGPQDPSRSDQRHGVRHPA